MQEKILKFFKEKEEYISGEELSEYFGISRQALWKHIHNLRDLGYEIVAVPHRGYKLISIPDRLLPLEIRWQLSTKFVGKKIYYFDSVSSTQDVALRLAEEGGMEGIVVIAETQRKGRGRMKRFWFSPKFKGIYLSIILRPHILPQQAPIITFLLCVAASEAIKEVVALDIGIKWPNDLIINNKKVGGVLAEINAEMDQVHFVVGGIGVNVNTTIDTLPLGASSLKEEKGEYINRVELTRSLLRKIEENYFEFKRKGASYIIEKWKNFSITLGKRVTVISHKEKIEGKAYNVDIDGALLLKEDSGKVRRIVSGEIIRCRNVNHK